MVSASTKGPCLCCLGSGRQVCDHPFPYLAPLSHCAAVVGCRNQPLAGMKDATTPLWMGGQFIAFSLCLI